VKKKDGAQLLRSKSCEKGWPASELYQPALEAWQRASGAQSFIAFPFRGLDRMKSHRNYLQKVLAQAWCKWSRFEVGKGDERGFRFLTVTPNLRKQ
jgi:hypothetical protein